MKRSTERILTTHVGSHHPARRRCWRSVVQKTGSPHGAAAYAAALREAVADVVRKQVAAGIDIVNDGEYGKSSWANYVLERIKGFEVREGHFDSRDWLGRERERFPELIEAEFGDVCQTPRAGVRWADRVSRPRRCETRRQNLNDALAGSGATEGFMTVVAPASAAFNAIDDYYHDERAYVMAMAEALRKEYLEVYRAGLIVQVDDAVLANMYDHLTQKSPREYRKWAELRIEALNHALRDIPRGSHPIPCLFR